MNKISVQLDWWLTPSGQLKPLIDTDMSSGDWLLVRSEQITLTPPDLNGTKEANNIRLKALKNKRKSIHRYTTKQLAEIDEKIKQLEEGNE